MARFTGAIEILGAVTVDSEENARVLAQFVLDRKRDRPIVCVTSRDGEVDPAMDPDELRAIVGTGVDIYFVPTGPATRALEAALPARLQVFGGATRIWWPRVSGKSDPGDHPLIHEPYEVYGSWALQKFKKKWDAGPPSRPKPAPSQVASLRRERDLARGQLRNTRKELRGMEAELADAVAKLAGAERQLRELRRELRDTGDTPAEQQQHKDPAAELHIRITEAWCDALPPADRRRHPLGPYLLGRDFLRTAREAPNVEMKRLAWVCAMVACGRAPELDGLDLHRLRSSAGGGVAHRVRESDGAAAWRCAIKQNTPAGPRLHFWRLEDGSVEFANVGHHDDMSITE